MTNSIEELISKGTHCIEIGKPFDALDNFRKVLDIERTNVNAWKGCAMAWDWIITSTPPSEDTKKPAQQSEQCWSRLIQLDSSNPEYFMNKGYVCQYYLDNSDTAMNCYRSALELDNSQSMVWMNIGVIFSNASDWENALDSYKKAIALDNKSKSIWLNFGITYARMKNFEKALECFDHSTQLDDSFVDGWKAKCQILDDLGRYDEAKVCGEKIYELTKNN
jgi:tetratricopeptide (TPR) repeat protein